MLELVVDDDEVIRRLSGRRTCRTCNHIWHVDFDPPEMPGVCDLDGGELFQRDDDKAETIANRLAVYAESTAPLVAYYASRGVLVGIDATGPVDDVTAAGDRRAAPVPRAGLSRRAPAGGPRGSPSRRPSRSQLMRAAGLVVARTLERVAAAVAPGVTTGALDALAEQTIRDEGAVPSFLGYHGFPGAICASVGAEVVHGIPSARRVLREGELLSIDCGAILDGWHGDAAVTVPVGDAARSCTRCRRSPSGRCGRAWPPRAPGGRLSDIGAAVEAVVRPHGYGLLEDYTGHGIGTAMHEPPAVPNLAPRGPGHGMELVVGLVLAVEPMAVLGSPEVRELDDDWTVVTVDGRQASHWEHTVAITAEGPWVLTALDGGAGRPRRRAQRRHGLRPPGRVGRPGWTVGRAGDVHSPVGLCPGAGAP